jgi:mannan endo-1,4-beta-mannosidase
MRLGRALATAALGLALAACGEDPATPAELEDAAANCPDASSLLLPREPRGLVLVNAYWLQEEAARAVRRGEPVAARVEEALGESAALGVLLVRTNGFNDDPAKAGDSAIQVSPLTYDETALRGLDLVLARARAHGVRLVLPLGNFWDAYGGARQYVAWAGLPSPEEGDPRFFRDRAVIDHFRAHVTALLSRVNTYDGLRYGEHPAVLAWELLNEPRADHGAPGRAELRAWVDELGAVVRSLAPGHLVGTGEEGVDPEQFGLLAASPHVDYATVHLYPERENASGRLVAASGAALISARAETARDNGKPLVVEELALRREGGLALEERRAILRGWLTCARRTGAAAAGPWMLAHDDRPDAWDAYQFKWWDGTAPEDPANQYVDLLRDAAAGW